MSWLRRASFALVVTGVAAACTLIDPLDDISGGPKATSEKKDGSSSSSSGASSGSSSGNDATSGTSSSSSSGAPGFACSGQKEQEPNDTAGQATALTATGVNFCGTLTGGAADVDRWRFTNTTGQDLQIVVTVDAESNVDLTIQSGSNQTTGSAGGRLVSSLAPGEVLALTLSASGNTTQNIGYHIVFAAN